MTRLAAMSVLTASAGVIALLVLGVAPGCGPSKLSKAYEVYDKKVEAILDREKAAWQKLSSLVSEQGHSETPDPQRLREVLTGESIPFYDALKGEVAAVAPDQPELASAHATLVKYADRRATFAHLVAGSLDVIARGDPWTALDAKGRALQSAMMDYARRLEGRVAPPDQRFALVQSADRDFQRLCVEPLAEGRLTAAQMGEIVKTRLQPKIREARNSSFDDDEEGRTVRAAVVACDEFLDAAQAAGPLLETSARLTRDLEALDRECTELFKKFMEEMKAIRGRM